MAASFLVAAIVLSSGILAAPAVSAKSAVLLDAETGRVLWQLHGNKKSLIASTTKIMTGLLIAESCDLQDMVRIPQEAVGIEGSSIHLVEAEQMTVESLLYGMMLQSGNDAAVALAIHHSADPDVFVNKMNEKARALGLEDTSYKNPHGLDDEGHFSTALDLAKLTAYAMKNEVFRKVVASKTASFGARTFTNHNKMLWKYDGAIGVKTGYTKAAGRILVSCAERNERELICVTISDPCDWADHCVLLDHGFSLFQNKEVLRADEFEILVPVMHGQTSFAAVGIGEDVEFATAEGERISFDYDLPKYAFAPVIEGQTAGEISILVDGKIVAKKDLLWCDSVLERS